MPHLYCNSEYHPKKNTHNIFLIYQKNTVFINALKYAGCITETKCYTIQLVGPIITTKLLIYGGQIDTSVDDGSHHTN